MMEGQFHLSKEIACEWGLVLDDQLNLIKQSRNTKNFIKCSKMQALHLYLSVVSLLQLGQVKAICMIVLGRHVP